MDTLKGLYKAKQNEFFDFNSYAVDEFEHYEKVENGDLNWCMDGKFLAFAGPQGQAGVSAENSHDTSGYQSLRPENYIEYFKYRNVTLVVRLNKKYYDARSFTNNGINHVDLYFLDGSNPPENILEKFMQMAEDTPGAVAVHCKAGLGRTGSLISCYLMKHFHFTGEEVIGWLRICRPGSIIGPQQHWVKSMQNRMWREGDIYRARIQEQELKYKPGPLDHLQAAADHDTIETGRKSTGRRAHSSRTGPNSARNSANLSLSSKMALLNVVNSYEHMHNHHSGKNLMVESTSLRTSGSNRGGDGTGNGSSRKSPGSSPNSGRNTGNNTRSTSNKLSSLTPRSQALAAMSDSTQTFTSQQESENRSQADYLLARRQALQKQQQSASPNDLKLNFGGLNNNTSNRSGTVTFESKENTSSSYPKKTTTTPTYNNNATNTGYGNMNNNNDSPGSSVDDSGNKRKSRFGNFLSSFSTQNRK